MQTLIALAVLATCVLVSQAASEPDVAASLMASIPSHLMMLFGLSGIVTVRGRLVKAGPLPRVHRAPNPTRRMSLAGSLAAVVVGLLALAPWNANALMINTLVISEVMFNPTGVDNQREWVEIYNGTASAIDLSTYSLGWGGNDYTTGTLQLSGVVGSGATFVVGGPLSDPGNGNPVYDQALDFGPNIQNGVFIVDGVALFDIPAFSIAPTTVPIDAVLYGIFNLNGLIDESGSPGAIDYFGFGAAGSSIELTDTGWISQPLPTPGSVPDSTPEPGTAILLGMGLAILATGRRADATSLRIELPISA